MNDDRKDCDWCKGDEEKSMQITPETLNEGRKNLAAYLCHKCWVRFTYRGLKPNSCDVLTHE